MKQFDDYNTTVTRRKARRNSSFRGTVRGRKAAKEITFSRILGTKVGDIEMGTEISLLGTKIFRYRPKKLNSRMRT